MECREVIESLEAYVAGDLDDRQASRVAEHLASCPACAVEYEQVRLLVGDLKDLGHAFQPTRVFADVPALGHHTNPTPVRAPRRWFRGWALAAAVMAVALAGAVVVVSVPSLAEAVPLPIGDRIGELKRQNDVIRDQNQRMQRRIDRLEKKVQDLTGDEVNVVGTAEPALPQDVNLAVQSVVIEFIKAQYAGDVARLKELSTPALQARIGEHPEDYLRDKAGVVSFAQMTDVSLYEEGGKRIYLEFVRLMDTKEFNESQYQENFGVVKQGNLYLVDSMETDV